jgi:hypothetical protein
MKKRTFIHVLFLFFIAGIVITCKKEFDNPPVKSAADADKINIKNIKDKYVAGINYKFKRDSNLYCVITADEVSGNFYKEIYVQDVTGAIHVNLLASGGFYIGDSIRINLKDAVLKASNSLIELDSVDSEKSIVKLGSGLKPMPSVITLSSAISNTVATNGFQSKLVKIDNVEFIIPDQNKPFADANARITLNRAIRSCDGKTLTVRTSGYANFASVNTPNQNGSITGILSQFGGTMQLLLRQATDVAMTGALCGAATNTNSPPTQTFALGAPVSSVSETFNSQTIADKTITLNGWLNFDQTGTKVWTTDIFSGNSSAKATSFGSTNTDSENKIWLISPPIVAATNPTLSFKSALSFTSANHPSPLTVYISKTFDGKNLSAQGTWTVINTATLPAPTTPYNTFVNSGIVNLSSYLTPGYTGNYFIAFRYSGSKPSGFTTNFYLDDIFIQ